MMTPICRESEPFVNMLTPERIRLKALPAYTIARLYHCRLIPKRRRAVTQDVSHFRFPPCIT